MSTPATLNVGTSIVAYGDSTINSNPRRRFVDWTRLAQGIAVANPKSEQFSIDPLATLAVFNGQRALLIDGTTQFSITASPLDASRFRITWTGGTAPGFRTDRGLVLNGIAVTVAVNPNGSAAFSLASGTWGTTIPGDTLYIPGTTTGDAAGVFSPLNEGYWIVLSVTGTTLLATRPIGNLFQGASQIATPTANSQVQTFSATGVQTTDKVELTSGFSLGSLRTYPVVTVTPSYIEIQSTIPMALDSGATPGNAGMVFYKLAKRYVRIEADQECAIQANGDTGTSQRIAPLFASDQESTGWYEKWGPMWSLNIVNRTASVLNVVVISVE